MNKEDILDILRAFQASGFAELELENKDWKLSLKSGKGQAPRSIPQSESLLPTSLSRDEQSSQINPATVEYSSSSLAPNHESFRSPETESPIETLRCPLVGSFYRSPESGVAPFVEVGDQVKKGDTVCIIDAMKMMNYIEAPCDGIVKSILVENGAVVAFDDLLMEFEKDV